MDTVNIASPLPEVEILSCPNDRQFPAHLHDGYVLWLNSVAGEHFRVQGNTDILQPGSISIIEPGVIHDNRPCLSHRRHLKSFYFSARFLKEMADQVSDRQAPPTLPTTVITDRRLWQDASILHEELFHTVSAMQAEVGLLSLFERIFNICGLPQDAGLLKKNDNRKVATAIAYFLAHIEQQFTLAELAELIGCTDFHLIRLFRAATGVSPHTYLVQLRLEHARKLLAAGSSIVDAALLSGFSDQSHLTRYFKARFGITPGMYRKQHK